MRDHFEWFSKFVIEYSDPKSVLDIACNDGSQLDCFKSKGVETFGIDPAENLHSLSSKNHNVIFSLKLKKNLKNNICDNYIKKLISQEIQKFI